jgi:dihydroflavonol-4-reductase
MAILITGATGFLGSHVLQALRQKLGSLAEVAVLTRSLAAWKATPHSQDAAEAQVVVGSLEAPGAWQKPAAAPGAPLFNGPLTGIYHLAAVVHHSRQGAAAQHAVNVEGTCNMVRLAKEHGCRLLFVSTSGTVACSRNPDAQPDEQAPHCTQTVQHWPYYSSKVAAEVQAQRLATQLGVRLIIVRPPMLLGPGDCRGRSSATMVRFLSGRQPFGLHGGIHYVDIRDAAAALVAAMQHPSPRPVYHLRGTACTLQRYFADLGACAHRRPPRLMLPHAVAKALGAVDRNLGQLFLGKPLGLLPDPVVLEMAAHYWNFSSTYAEADLGFAPRPGKVTLQDCVAWLQRERPELRG